MSSLPSWSPPQFLFAQPSSHRFSLNLEHDPHFAENFVRAIDWSPDGSTLLARCENRDLQLFDVEERRSRRVFKQSAPVLDAIWYPTANVSNLATYCFAASVRESPVKLLDASDGRLRASYSIVDHRERQIAPHCLSFNYSAQKLYCGFEDAIEIFSVDRPGCEGHRLHTTPGKKSKDGLKGIISALAFSPTYDASSTDFFAAGSLTPTSSNITLFNDEAPVMFVGGGPKASVTQLHIPPSAPHMLYAAYRRHSAIYSWDMRGTLAEPLAVYDYSPEDASNSQERARLTNQKMKFDIEWGGRYMITGDQQGSIHVYDIQHEDPTDTTTPGPASSSTSRNPTMSFKAHSDSIGSVSFHPIKPLVVSASGSRHFDVDEDDESQEESSEDEPEIVNEDGTDFTRKSVKRTKERPRPRPVDKTIKVWDFGDGSSVDVTSA